MRQDLDQLLCDRYPLIFDGRGCACGDGWFFLLETLAETLQRSVTHCTPPHPQVIATQVKEKFGGLRFYVDGADDYQRGMIDLAEELSTSICEKCGAPGRLLLDAHEWAVTRCPAHAPAGARPAESETPTLIDGVRYRFQPVAKEQEK